MEKGPIKLVLISIYTLMLVVCTIILYNNYHHLYDQVTIVEDQEAVARRSQLSIPIKIEIYNEKWGSYVFENEEAIQKIWKAMNEITMGPTDTEPSYPLKEDVKISGHINYINGSSDFFEIGSWLVLNDQTYDDNYKMPLIDNLKNELLSYLYSQQRIADIMETAVSVTLRAGGVRQEIALSDNDRQKLKRILLDSIKIETNREVINLLKNKGNALGHIRIYLQDAASISRQKAADLVNIDVYEDAFFVVQYMGDENGRHMYFRGPLDQLVHELEKNAGEKRE